MPLNASAIYPASDPEFITFPSRRSVVHSANGMVACTQPLAAQAGQRILRAGGNAADAAVAVAAALNMTEPSSTGIGGDMFCLFYNSKTKKVESLNGSGRSAGKASLEQMRTDLGLKSGQRGSIPMTSVHAVTTPGAAAGWVDTVERFGSGKLTLEDVLTPAIELGEEGYPVSELASMFWKAYESRIRNASPNFGEMLKSDKNAPDGYRAPRPGELFHNPNLAKTLRSLAKHGKKGFYSGPVAESLVKVVQDLGGHLELEDLEYHANTGTETTKPLSLRFNGQNIGNVQSKGLDGQPSESESQGVDVWEHPPNGQGIIALMALGILEALEKTNKIRTFTSKDHNSAAYLHAVIEALRIAFADGTWFITDPNVVKVPTSSLISRSYLASRAKLFDPDHAASHPIAHGSPAHSRSDTVYFATTDKDGNGCSFINSNYGGFGTCIIPAGCGFTLQNRGANFSLDADHPNVFAPRKRPYHTIIPAMITNPNDGSLHSVYGVMGGFMQPQGHVQVLLNMLVFKLNPQSALDAPRFCIGAGTPDEGDVLDTVFLEEGISEEVAEELRSMGHKIEIVGGWKRGLFGRGQIIRCHFEEGRVVYSAGSDPRGDGGAFPV